VEGTLAEAHQGACLFIVPMINSLANFEQSVRAGMPRTSSSF